MRKLLILALFLPVIAWAQAWSLPCPITGIKYSCLGSVSFPNGDRYVGSFRDNKLEGNGIYTYSNGSKFVGEYRNDKRHGHGVFYDADGSVKQSGVWQDGELSQSALFDSTRFPFTSPKQAAVASFLIPLPRSRLPRCSAEESDLNSRRNNCFGTLIFTDGSRYVGEWRDDAPHGSGARYQENGTALGSGLWVRGFLAHAHSPNSTVNSAGYKSPPPIKTTSNQSVTAPSSTYPATVDSKTCANIMEFYPRQSRLQNEIGKVVMRFVVQANGTLESIEFERSSGYKRLDQAAKKLLESCKFKAGMLNGKLQKSFSTLEIEWSLDESISMCPDKQPSSQWTNCVGFVITNDGQYSGNFVRGKESGFGIFLDAKGIQYVGNFFDGKPDGLGVQFESNGTVLASGRWFDGKLIEARDLSLSSFPFNPILASNAQLSTRTEEN